MIPPNIVCKFVTNIVLQYVALPQHRKLLPELNTGTRTQFTFYSVRRGKKILCSVNIFLTDFIQSSIC
jgi:hypothetical protein